MNATHYLMAFSHTPPMGRHVIDMTQTHLTILQGFSIPQPYLSPYLRSLVSMAKNFEPFALASNGHAFFGHNHDIPVTLVQGKALDIHRLHRAAYALTKLANGKFEHEAFMGEKYNPHLSHAKQPPDDPFTHLTLVRHIKGRSEKSSVLTNFTLGRSL